MVSVGGSGLRKTRVIDDVLAAMERLHDRIATPAALLLAASLVTVVAALSLGRYPAMGGDEVYYSSPALHLITDGTLARTFQRGGFEQFDCYPPLLTLVIASFYQLFGFGVIQTMLPTLLLGLATATLLFIVGCRLGGRNAASIATLVFVLDPITYETWVSGRYDDLVAFLIIAAVATGFFSAARGTGRALVRGGLAAGLLIGLAGVSYYPFTGIALLVGVIAIGAGFSSRIPRSARATSLVAYAIGWLAIVGVLLTFLYPHQSLCRSEVGHLSHGYFDPSMGLRGQLMRILDEARRYYYYAIGDLGLANLLLSIAVLYVIARTRDSRWQFWTLGVATVLFMAFLATYGIKERPRYMATVIALWCLGLAFVEGRSADRPPAIAKRTLIKPLVCLAVFIGLARMSIVMLTVGYQWQGRDYLRFDREVRSAIPATLPVIGPQIVWYSLAPEHPFLWLYGITYWPLVEACGVLGMNNPANLRDVQYVILSDRGLDFLTGLRSYVGANFRLVKRVRLPFHPLPWAATPPFIADIYQRASPGAGVTSMPGNLSGRQSSR